MVENKNKIILIILLGIFFVGASFYFSESEENIPLEENISAENISDKNIPEKNISDEPAKKILQVFVSGQVKNISVVKLEDNGNLCLADAVNAAGGLTEFADTEVINLAEPLTDGAHIHIPTKEINLQESLESQISSAPTSDSDLVNINTADETELQKLYRVGPAIAKRIIEFRQQNGKFQTVEDIKKVRGIGEKTFQKMKDKITVQ